MEIPAFDIHGVIPPIRPGVDGSDVDRSPYRISASALIERFATTAERGEILRGFLRLRSDLRAAGFGEGFQWVDGSFVEDIELSRGRSPGDVDVVSFLRVGDVATARQRAMAAPRLFRNHEAKLHYRVDHYVIRLDLPLDEPTAKLISYWYSMWSHRRDDNRWKGFVQLSLTDDDAAAEGLLEARRGELAERGNPHGA